MSQRNFAKANPNCLLKTAFPTDKITEIILCKLETVYEQNQSLLVPKPGYIKTPLHSLKDLVRRYNEPIHTEVQRLPGFGRNHLVVVEIFAGAFRGVGQSFHLRLSKQMAALDILRKMKIFSPQILKNVVYGLCPGWRIMSHVFSDLLDACQKNGLLTPRFVTKTNTHLRNFPLYTVKCKLGKKTIAVGHSDCLHVANKLAAFKSIYQITGLSCPLEYVALGTSCLSYKDLVARGIQPKLSAEKRKWFLDNLGSDVPSTASGVDLDELEDFKAELQREKTGKS